MPYKNKTPRMSASVARKRTRVIKPANDNVPEWRLQAAQCRRLRAMPEYGRDFLIVGGMEAGKRGPFAAVQAQATGLTAGHPDMTVFLRGGRCAFIENKTMTGRVSSAQKDRHAALNAIGFSVEVVRAGTEQDAADKAESLVRGWMKEK